MMLFAEVTEMCKRR